MELVGVDQVIELAHRMGITSTLARDANTAIGGSAVRMLDLGAAYSVIARDGRRVTPRGVLRIADGSGTPLLDAGGGGSQDQVVPPGAARQVTGILQDYAAHWGLPFDRPTAGKSGTTDGNVDAWYVAYTPTWVVATWVGHTDGASAAETGMDGIGGNDVARAITAPFVAMLPTSDSRFAGQPATAPPADPACHGKSCGNGGDGGDGA